MRADDLSKALSPKEFRAFVMNLSNGESYQITHPEQVLVDRLVATIGTKRLDSGRRYEELVTCTLMHIVSLIPIEEMEVKWIRSLWTGQALCAWPISTKPGSSRTKRPSGGRS